MDLSAIIDEFNRRKAQAGQRISDMFTPPKKPDNWFSQMNQVQQNTQAQVQTPAPKTYGYEHREPYQGEQSYFKDNPNVAGMATEDNKIILNPNSKLSDQQKEAVRQNEAARLWMRQNKFDPQFKLTPEQVQAFSGTSYANNDLDLKHTIIARILSGDPSAGNATPEQQAAAEQVKRSLQGNAPAGQRSLTDMFTLPKKPDDWFQQMQQGQNAVITPEQRSNVHKELADIAERMASGIVPEPIRARERAMRTDPSAAAKPFTSEEVKGITPFVTAAAPIAFHGTPHTFDKFDASKIGTGQGAQSYGHGLYFAENKAVANSYANELMNKKIDEAARLGKPMPAIKEGTTYQVNIPDQHAAKMLDWDKPLSEQAHLPKELVSEVTYQLNKPASEITGEKFYQILAARRGSYNQSTGGRIDPQAASKVLADAGIPGIKYLDQGSRAAGTGMDGMGVTAWAKKRGISEEEAMKGLGLTRNFVVFDPAILEDVTKK